MKLILVRDKFNQTQTLGKLYVDGVFECYTLEDVVREVPGSPVLSWKIPGDTAIPRGLYTVRFVLSPSRKVFTPRLLNVPGFEGILIHSGNTEKDTEGCILLGDVRFASYIGSSRTACARVYDKIQGAQYHGKEVTISVG